MKTKIASIGIVALMLIGGFSVATAQGTPEAQAQDRITELLAIAENSANALETYNENQDIPDEQADELIENAKLYIASAYELVDAENYDDAATATLEALGLLKEAAAILDVMQDTPAGALMGQKNRLQASIKTIGTINERLAERGYDNTKLQNFLEYANDALSEAEELIQNGNYEQARIMLNELHVRRDTVQNSINEQATERVNVEQAKGFVNSLQRFYNNANDTICNAQNQGLDTQAAENMLSNLMQKMQQAKTMHQNGFNAMSLEKVRQAMVAAHNLSMEMHKLKGQI